MRVYSTYIQYMPSVNVALLLPSSAAASSSYCGEHSPESGFLLMAIQTQPQHSSVLGRESQHVFLCVKILVEKQSYI